jgi:RNA-binding protein
MDKKKILGLRGKAQAIKATVYVGKDGITDEVVEELLRQLKKNKLVKAKLLPPVEEDRRVVGEDLAHRTQSVLVEVRGRTVVLATE